MAAAAKPRSARSSATLAAVRLVRLKTIVRPRPLACSMRASISTLSIACARKTCCVIALTVCEVSPSPSCIARMWVGWVM